MGACGHRGVEKGCPDAPRMTDRDAAAVREVEPAALGEQRKDVYYVVTRCRFGGVDAVEVQCRIAMQNRLQCLGAE